MVHNEPGWLGAFTREQVEGAIANGKRVVKADSEPNDATPNGTPGIVLGSMREPDGERRVMYFIEWANRPHCAVACIDFKLRKGDDS